MLMHRHTRRGFAVAGLVSLLIGGLTACSSGDRDRDHGSSSSSTTTSTRDTRSDGWWLTEGGSYSPTVGRGQSASSLAFPTGDRRTSALLLHTVAPTEVAASSGFQYTLHVTNLTGGTLQNVVLTQSSAENMNISSSDPSYSRGQGGGIVWGLGDLGPNQTRVITVNADAGSSGMTQACLSVSYNNVLCFSTNVVNPDLTIVKSLPEESMRCDSFVMTYRVCNPGTGTTGRITVIDELPEGLETLASTRRIEFTAGPLAAGACEEFEIDLRATRTGTFGSAATANDGTLRAGSNEPRIRIVQPVLNVECTSRELIYLGRPATFEYTITNSGNAPSNNTVVNVSMPSNATLESMTQNGVQSGNSVQWNLGALAPNASKTVAITVRAQGIGELVATANVSGVCAEPVTTTCRTAVQGIPALLLEVVDLDDPIEVGATTTYVIRVTNQGSAVDTNVRIDVTPSRSQTYITSTGPTSTTVSADGRKVTFAPLASLAPGAVAEWRVVVRADAEGDVRFGVEMNSDNLTRPVNETESTYQYN